MPEARRPLADLPPAHQRRLNWAMRGMSQALISALDLDRGSEAAPLRQAASGDRAEMLARLIMERADPTANKRFTAWLVREYAAGRLILEDLGAANETLSLFQRYAPRLKPEQRDIQRYGSLAAAWEVVRGFADRDEAHSNNAQKALDRAKAYEESRILRQDPDGFTVAVPLTEFAAKWWGRGTRWCTAADKDNQFKYYHYQAPLFVILVPEVGKFQMWYHENSFMLMDAADRTVRYEFVLENWKWLQVFIKGAAEKTGGALAFLPQHLRTSKVYLSAVRQNGEALKFVPKQARTKGICRAALENSYLSLQWFPENLKTPEWCLAAIKHSDAMFDFTPVKFLTSEFYHDMVRTNGRSLRKVPRPQRTYDLCLSAIHENWRAIDSVPKELFSEELCLIAISQDGYALEWIPLEYRSAALCLAAIEREPFALKHVPEIHRSLELCMRAVQKNGEALRYVPAHLQTSDICMAAVRNTSVALFLIEGNQQTREVCTFAVSQDGGMLTHVAHHLKTAEMCQMAVSNRGGALFHVPEKFVTDEMMLTAVRNDGDALRAIPYLLRSKELCLEAIAQSPYALTLIPTELLEDREFCALALEIVRKYCAEGNKTIRPGVIYLPDVDRQRSALASTPTETRSFERCFLAVHIDGLSLEFVPQQYKTKEVCLAALHNNNKAWEFVPDELKKCLITLMDAPERDAAEAARWNWGSDLLDEWTKRLNEDTNSMEDLTPHASSG